MQEKNNKIQIMPDYENLDSYPEVQIKPDPIQQHRQKKLYILNGQALPPPHPY